MTTPMSTACYVDKDETSQSIDIKKYWGMIGSFLYLSASRPDIMFSECMCARFQSNPKESLLQSRLFTSVLTRCCSQRCWNIIVLLRQFNGRCRMAWVPLWMLTQTRCRVLTILHRLLGKPDVESWWFYIDYSNNRCRMFNFLHRVS